MNEEKKENKSKNEIEKSIVNKLIVLEKSLSDSCKKNTEKVLANKKIVSQIEKSN